MEMAKRPFPHYRKGASFKLSDDALDNYGEEYRDTVFIVNGVFTHAVPVSKMADDPTGHPGFDECAGSALYEADGLNFALYEWEMEAC
jgi:hypothetical protein